MSKASTKRHDARHCDHRLAPAWQNEAEIVGGAPAREPCRDAASTAISAETMDDDDDDAEQRGMSAQQLGRLEVSAGENQTHQRDAETITLDRHRRRSRRRS